MTVHEPQVTLDDFIQFVFRDENVERMFELIHGKIVEVLPSRSGHSNVAVSVSSAFWSYCRRRGCPTISQAQTAHHRARRGL